MQIKNTYKGITENNVIGLWCGFKPDNVTIIKEIQILYPDNNKQLKNKLTGEILPYVVLNDTSQDDYEEVEFNKPYENTTDIN